MAVELILSLIVDILEDAGTLERLGVLTNLPKSLDLWTNRLDFVLALSDLGLSAVAHSRQAEALRRVERQRQEGTLGGAAAQQSVERLEEVSSLLPLRGPTTFVEFAGCDL